MKSYLIDGIGVSRYIEDKKNNGYTYRPNKESFYTYIEYLKTHPSKRHTYGDYLRYKKEHNI